MVSAGGSPQLIYQGIMKKLNKLFIPTDIAGQDTLKSSVQCDVDSSISSQLSFNNQNSDSGIHDADNNIVDNGKLIDFVTNDLNLSDDCGIVMSDFSKEENDVQVKDEPEVKLNNLQNSAVPTVENKFLANISPRQSFGNILLSFDSPVTGKEHEDQSSKNVKETQKLYIEEEFQKAFKIQELSLQDTFLKKQHDLKISKSQKQEELEAKIEKQSQIKHIMFRNIVSVTKDVNSMRAKFSPSSQLQGMYSKIVIAGGGTGGITMASRIRGLGENDITIIEPSEVHYYQPYWTLVGGRMKKLEDSCKPMSSVIPRKVKWLKDKVTSFCPDDNVVKTEKNGNIHYDYLIVALGLQLAFNKWIKGLPDAFNTPGVCSNYSAATVALTPKALENFKGGNAIFTQPINPIKCAGAPQKIMYLAEEYFTKYEMLHVTPPMVAPAVVSRSKLSDTTGFMDVDKNTLQSNKYPNVFGIGDCTNIPTSKTAAAVASQSEILSKNFKLALQGKNLINKYYGYTACPLVTGYKKGIMAEFDFDLKPVETLPVDQGKERYISFILKRDVMPILYWNFMLKGYWPGPRILRKILHLGFT